MFRCYILKLSKLKMELPTYPNFKTYTSLTQLYRLYRLYKIWEFNSFYRLWLKCSIIVISLLFEILWNNFKKPKWWNNDSIIVCCVWDCIWFLLSLIHHQLFSFGSKNMKNFGKQQLETTLFFSSLLSQRVFKTIHHYLTYKYKFVG